MNKELEALEVLKLLKDFLNGIELGNVDKLYVGGSLNIIKSALEQKEKLEKVWNIAKTHIALDYWLIKSCDTVFAYNNLTITNQLTEEEFNLLKEMLK